MGLYLVRRLGMLILTLILTSIIVFLITKLLPGDVAAISLGREASAEALENKREELGLNRPLPVQYIDWLGNFVTGDWGTMFSTGEPVRPKVMLWLGASLKLAILTLFIAVPLALLLGVIAGRYANRWVDHLISVSTLSVVSLPEFITGLVLIQVLAHQWRWFQATSAIRPGASWPEALPFLILPAMTATLVLLAYITRLVRAGVIEELQKPYVRTAILKGLSRQNVLTRHVLRNALMPTVTIIAISFGWLISGLIVIENVFNYPGLGRLLIFAIDNQDLPLLQAITLVVVTGVVFANLLADLLYAYLNPRIRLK
jgi:peptide/nickel transport system permease protein